MYPVSLSVFFPCYNEAENVEKLVADALAAVAPLVERYEIIIVNDGSSDATGAIADRLSAANPNVRVIHHEKNRGYGGALISGFRGARYDWVFFADGDNRGLDAMRGCAAIHDERDAPAEFLHHVLRAGRADAPEAVCARRGKRAAERRANLCEYDRQSTGGYLRDVSVAGNRFGMGHRATLFSRGLVQYQFAGEHAAGQVQNRHDVSAGK